MSQYKTVIVGAGQIGAFYDTPENPFPLTHAHAYCRNVKTKLLGFVDTNATQAQKAAKLWNTEVFEDLEQAFEKGQPDIVSVCVPTNNHLEAVEKILKYRPKFLFLEKPLSPTLEEATQLYEKIKAAKVPCMVNYLRRFDRSVVKLKKQIEENSYGRFQGGVGIYSKGLKNNGSHLVNLLFYLLGEPKSFLATENVCDYSKEDLTIGGVVHYNQDQAFHLLGARENYYSIFESIFLFEKAKIQFKNSGFQVCIGKVRPDPIYPGYQDLDSEAAFKTTHLHLSFDEAVNSIIRYLDYGNQFESSIEEAYRSEVFVHKLAQSVKKLSD